MASTSSNSLFGGGALGATTQPSALFTTNSPMNSVGNTFTQGQSTGSLFSGQPQPQQQSNPSSNLGQSQMQANVTQSSRPPNQSTQPAFFNSLLERGKKRPLSTIGRSSNYEELPSLQLGLDDIRRKARELGNGGTKGPQHIQNSKAYVYSSDLVSLPWLYKITNCES